jgi:hypothetical protein
MVQTEFAYILRIGKKGGHLSAGLFQRVHESCERDEQGHGSGMGRMAANSSEGNCGSTRTIRPLNRSLFMQSNAAIGTCLR